MRVPIASTTRFCYSPRAISSCALIIGKMDSFSSNVKPCPLLPEVSERYRAVTHRCPSGPADAYLHRLRYAQSLWLEQKPAQALLQLNHAFTVDLPDDSASYSEHSWPYEAKLWLALNSPEGVFVGNPVRHYQHYATRLPADAPRRELRAVRAWLCFWIMRRELPEEEYPRDEFQIENESLVIPSEGELVEQLEQTGRVRETECAVQFLG